MFSLPGREKLRRLTVGFDSMDNEKYFDRQELQERTHSWIRRNIKGK